MIRTPRSLLLVSAVQVIERKQFAAFVRICIWKIHCSVLIAAATAVVAAAAITVNEFQVFKRTHPKNHLSHTWTAKTGIPVPFFVLISTHICTQTQTLAHTHSKRTTEFATLAAWTHGLVCVCVRSFVRICAEQELLEFHCYIWQKLHDIRFSRSLNTDQINTFIQEITPKPRGSKY